VGSQAGDVIQYEFKRLRGQHVPASKDEFGNKIPERIIQVTESELDVHGSRGWKAVAAYYDLEGRLREVLMSRAVKV
jgi:hypothetical protein